MEPKPDIIRTDLLQVGDILLIRSDGLLGATIRTGGYISTGARGRFTHAMICCDPPVFIEAMSEGVRKVDLRSCYVADRQRVRFLRVRAGLFPSENLDRLRVTANNMFSAGYSELGAVGSVVSLLRNKRRLGVFCSQLVARCLNNAGVRLFGELPPEQVTPTHIEQCSSLEDVTAQLLEPARCGQTEGLEYVDGGLGSNAPRRYQSKLREVHAIALADVSSVIDAGTKLGVSVRPESLQSLVDALAKTKQAAVQAGNRAVVSAIAEADHKTAAAIEAANLGDMVEDMIEVEGASHARLLASLHEASLNKDEQRAWLTATQPFIDATEQAIQNRTRASNSWLSLAAATGMSSVRLMGEIERRLLYGVQRRLEAFQEAKRILTFEHR